MAKYVASLSSCEPLWSEAISLGEQGLEVARNDATLGIEALAKRKDEIDPRLVHRAEDLSIAVELFAQGDAHIAEFFVAAAAEFF